MRPFYDTNQALRFTEKQVNINERETFFDFFDEQIKLYGQQVDYYIHNYPLSSHDAVYGEQPTATYAQAIPIIMYVDLTEDSLFLSKFGLQGDDDVTAFVTISSYKTTMSAVSVNGTAVEEPKAGDIFKLTEYGSDRPGGRDGKLFEVTQRLDQEVGTINPVLGHYIWLIKAKRLDYSFEPGITPEKKSDQVIDGSFAGRLSGYTNPQSDTKVDSTNSVDEAAKDNWDYGVGDNDDIYGDYY